MASVVFAFFVWRYHCNKPDIYTLPDDRKSSIFERQTSLHDRPRDPAGPVKVRTWLKQGLKTVMKEKKRRLETPSGLWRAHFGVCADKNTVKGILGSLQGMADRPSEMPVRRKAGREEKKISAGFSDRRYWRR